MNELPSSTDLVSAAWQAWTGVLPTATQHKLLNACCVLCLDHGSEPPSAQATRLVSSCGKPLADAVAAGLLTLGPRHGNAGSAAARLLKQALLEKTSAEDVVRIAMEKKERLPGFGHPVYKTEDPRTTALLKIEKECLPATPHADFAVAVSAALTAAKQKPLPLNIDGALGAVIADLGAPDVLADALFLWARTAGLVSQALDASSLPSYLR